MTLIRNMEMMNQLKKRRNSKIINLLLSFLMLQLCVMQSAIAQVDQTPPTVSFTSLQNFDVFNSPISQIEIDVIFAFRNIPLPTQYGFNLEPKYFSTNIISFVKPVDKRHTSRKSLLYVLDLI